MAFFKLEDRHGEIECICFTKAFKELGAEIFLENAVYAEGTVSFKDEEQPKIIINSLIPLTENEFYHREQKQEIQKSTVEVENSTVSADSSPISPLSMYLSMYAMSVNAENPKPAEKKAPTPTIKEKVVNNPAIPTKLYLRVEDMQNKKFLKAKNVVDIFNEGQVKVIFYDMSTKKYQEYSERLNYSEYAASSLRKILGEDNVVFK